MTWIVLITMLTTLLGGGGVVYAANDALPGEVLYPVKAVVEDVQLALTGPEGDVALLDQFAQRRVEEVQALIAAGRYEDIPLAMQRYQEQVQEMVQVMEQLGPQDNIDHLTHLQETMAQHTQVLTNLLERVPPTAQPAIEHAMSASQHGMEVIQQMFSGGNPSELAPGQNKADKEGYPSEHGPGQNNHDTGQPGMTPPAGMTPGQGNGEGHPSNMPGRNNGPEGGQFESQPTGMPAQPMQGPTSGMSTSMPGSTSGQGMSTSMPGSTPWQGMSTPMPGSTPWQGMSTPMPGGGMSTPMSGNNGPGHGRP